MILGSYIKQPADVLDYDIDYMDFLSDGDSISAKSVAVSPNGLTIDSSAIFGTRVKVWLSGGTNGITYKVTVTATTTDGRVKQDEFKVKVKDY